MGNVSYEGWCSLEVLVEYLEFFNGIDREMLLRSATVEIDGKTVYYKDWPPEEQAKMLTAAMIVDAEAEGQ